MGPRWLKPVNYEVDTGFSYQACEGSPNRSISEVRLQEVSKKTTILEFKRANCKEAEGEIRGVPAPLAFCNMRLKDAQ